jgi:hypothetical protein
MFIIRIDFSISDNEYLTYYLASPSRFELEVVKNSMAFLFNDHDLRVSLELPTTSQGNFGVTLANMFLQLSESEQFQDMEKTLATQALKYLVNCVFH